MTDEPRARRSGLSCAVGTFAAGSLLLVLYPLSTGPFCWLVVHAYISNSQCELANNTIYAPIAWSVHNSESVRAVMQAWLNWWAGSL